MHTIRKSSVSSLLKAYYPLLFVLLYINGTLIVSVFGPIDYVDYDRHTVSFFIICTLAFFTIGYCVAVKTPLPQSQRFKLQKLQKLRSKIFRYSFFLAFVSIAIIALKSAVSGSLSFNISQSGEAYSAAYDGYERNTGSYSIDFLLATLFAFPTYVATIWGLFYFGTLSRKQRTLLLFMIAATIVVFTISGGKQKQFGDYLIYFITIFFVKSVLSGKFSLSAFIKIVCSAFGGVFVLLILLGIRYAAISIDLDTINGSIHPLMLVDTDHPIILLFGDNIGFAAAMFSGYLGQGFYGLSLSLQQDFTWTSFAGSSYSWSVILNRFFGLPFMVENSYPYLVGVNTGWAATKWHSVYAWLASDLTFTGTAIFNLVIGYVFGRLWKEIIVCQNPFSVLLFCLLVVGAFYAPANNQLMHSPGALSTLFLTLWLYLRYRASYNFQSLTRQI